VSYSGGLIVDRSAFRVGEIDSLGRAVVFLPCCDVHSPVAVVDCAGFSPPRAPSCFTVM